MKKVLIVLVALVVIAAIAFGVRTIGARDETSTVDTKDAAKLVQEDGKTDAGEVAAGDRPMPGTYSYTGSGRESISALGGSEHVFPKEIAIVVELADDADSCEWTANVVYVKEHVEERNYCTKDGFVYDRGFTRKIEFFNTLQTTEYECDDDAVRLRPEAQEGDTWEWECRQGDKATSAYTARALGSEMLTVGGDEVEVQHTKVTSRQTGETNGGDTSEFWLAESGLIVRFTADLDVKTKSVLGETRFREQLTYALTSLVPDAA